MALIQIPEHDTGTPRLRHGGEEFVDISSRESQRRVSFSSFLARQEEVQQLQQLQLDAAAAAPIASSSGDQPADFEFIRPKSPRGGTDSTAFPADELFYDGKMLPLEPMSRMAMVKDLNTLRRGGSAPPSPYFSSSGSGKAPTTQKSSSYPPRGRSSRRFKDFFFVALKKSHSTPPISPPPPPPPPPSSKPASSSSNLLRNIFFGRKESSPSPVPTSSRAAQAQVGDHHNQHHHHSKSKQQQQRKNRAIASFFPPSPSLAMDMNFTRSAPATPLHHRASGGGFVPVLHVPACIGPAKVSKFFSGSTNKTVEVFM
ncbi:hypothetical protein SELMODRAFT_418364 [Selaginella moellendorffii]|uniref:Uncharacterized protein n=1 Tax=Selaginella moellendorffii TaxID=88036 RepID=D8S5H2_SELML|nr:uncharacterized protein LOC9653622 [Selaginella moellendorffii]EFJ20594.1 hypothetical protein SELMODRAFT_418364 [Selaginella moellendorffii]|eukprot:XP_002978608.1 uncharacterized protein LOC9653622 [Selaginella moellendorffii]